jgi:hypothetical protein
MALPVRLKSTRWNMHVQDQVDAVLAGPGHVVVEPAPAGVLEHAGRRIVVEGAGEHVEPNGVHPHLVHPLEVDLGVIGHR